MNNTATTKQQRKSFPDKALETAMSDLPSWDLTSEYSDFGDSRYSSDVAELQALISHFQVFNEKHGYWLSTSLAEGSVLNTDSKERISELAQDFEAREKARTLIRQLVTYCRCLVSVDSRSQEAQKQHSLMIKIGSQLDLTLAPIEHWFQKAPESFITEYLRASPQTAAEDYRIRHYRLSSKFSLSLEQEKVIKAFEVEGISAWGNLYNAIQGEMSCKLQNANGETSTIGLTEATQRLREGNELVRKEAFLAIDSCWRERESTCSQILNSISGWRWANYQLREKQSGHVIDELTYSLHHSHIQRSTLKAMNKAILDFRPKVQARMKVFAKALGKMKIDPWDTFAPSPFSANVRTFSDAMKDISESFSAVDSELSDFAKMAYQESWIEARMLPNKTQGAYCASFPKSKTSRVFMTYSGSYKDMSTLAHELGHGFHALIMRDLPRCQNSYPMTLAETASVFAEQALAEGLSQNSDMATKRELAWQSFGEAMSFLINIPMRFEFESEVYLRRRQSPLTGSELNQMMEKYWHEWYGEHSQGVDQHFWCSKLHFYLPHISFYNYPYAFGYLFSLSIFALRKKHDKKTFFDIYKRILLDSGRMSCEDLVEKHLGQSISQPEFWQNALALIESKLELFDQIYN